MILQIICESKYIEQLGLKVPDIARNIALQEDKLLKYVDGLQDAVSRYHRVMASLESAEVLLLDEHIKELRRIIRPALKRLNWNSLGIADFISFVDNVS